jgi:SWI/SNF-related matrix-associated actin-dependent regulator 1 of chromatin subfamily A
MGLGKTVQAIAAVSSLNLYPCVVVCPTSVRDAWANEINYATHPPYIEHITGRRGPVYGGHVMIVSYELLASREVQLANTRPKCIVFDEAQYLKEPKPGQKHRAAVATRLGTWIKRSVLLTGTPVLNRPKEWWRLLHIVDSKEWDSLADFIETYCRQPEADKKSEAIAKRTAVVTTHGSASNLDELQVRTQPMMLRRLKRDVLTDLPAKRRDRSIVTLPSDILLHYKAAEQDLVKWLRLIGAGARVPAAERNIALVKLMHLRRLAAVGKLKQAVPELLRARFATPNADPLVVFGHHRDVVRGVAGLGQRLKLRVAVIDGDTPPTHRGAIIAAFQGGQLDLFCGSFDAAGTGITLTRANEMWMVERSYVPSKLAQAEDRLHRVSQVRPVQITYIDAAGTVDDDIARVLAAKQRLITGVVGDEGQTFTPEDDEAIEDDAIAEFVRRVELEPPTTRAPAADSPGLDKNV